MYFRGMTAVVTAVLLIGRPLGAGAQETTAPPPASEAPQGYAPQPEAAQAPAAAPTPAATAPAAAPAAAAHLRSRSGSRSGPCGCPG